MGQDNLRKNIHEAFKLCVELANAVEAMEVDNHYWSARPCETCQQMTAALGRDFGCVAKRKASQKEQCDEQ